MDHESFAGSDLKFFKQLLDEGYRPSVIFDIGASNAQWSTCVSEILPDAEYHLFEPMTALADSPYQAKLRENLAAHPEFTMHPIALGRLTGMTELSVTPDIVGSSLHVVSMPSVKQVEVPCWRMEEYVRAKNLPQPQVIKMDVQGYEACVLEGAGDLLPKADVLIVETWLYRSYGPDTPLLTEIVEALAPLGFSLVELGGAYIDPRRRITAIDAFFISDRIIDDLKRKETAAMAVA
jgi:FkbM family methyltransferase